MNLADIVIAFISAGGLAVAGGGARWIYKEYKANRDTAIEQARNAGMEAARAEAYQEKSEETIAAKNLEITTKDHLITDLQGRMKQYEEVDIPSMRAATDTLRKLAVDQQAMLDSMSRTIESQQNVIHMRIRGASS